MSRGSLSAETSSPFNSPPSFTCHIARTVPASVAGIVPIARRKPPLVAKERYADSIYKWVFAVA